MKPNATTNSLQTSRRRFLQTAAAVTTLPAIGSLAIATPSMAAEPLEPEATRKRPLRLALASYTLRNFKLPETIAMTVRVGLDAICLKSMHLPLDASVDRIQADAAEVRKAGLELYGGGVIQMNNEAEVNQAFEYAKAAGMTKIIGVPAPAMLPLVNDKVQQYDIAVCIHNNGPGDNVYTTPDMAYERIKTLDKRIGVCHDVGHTVRVGKDPAVISEQCADRLLDVHIKDVTAATAAGHSTPCGRGVIDLPHLLRTFI